MKPIYRTLAWLTLRASVWLFRAPFALALGAVKLVVLRDVVTDTMTCGTCASEIALLGLWVCGRCGYAWHGWYFTRCEVCGDVPPWVECGRCGASTMNPLLFG